MKEGAWINAKTGKWSWSRDHVSFIQEPANSMSLGMDEGAARRLALMPRDFNGPGRKAILLAAMALGFIRVRGHGADCTFEHTLSQARAINAAKGFMAASFGPMMLCRFTNLRDMSMVELPYSGLACWIEGQHPRLGCDQRLTISSDLFTVGP